MASSEIRNYFSKRPQVRLLIFLILISTGFLSFAVIAYPIALRPYAVPLNPGDVSTQDIQAPYSHSFVSQILTLQSQEDAENSIFPVYLPADPGITRRQIEKYHHTLSYIDNVRSDSFATSTQKIVDLRFLANTQLPSEISEQIISMSDNRWQGIKDESLVILEQVMRNTIRTEDINDQQRRISSLISYSLTQDQATIVTELVSPFIVANSIRSEEKTHTARLAAKNSVTPVKRNFASGEIIIRRGQVVNALAYEALSEFGLSQPKTQNENLLATAALVSLIFSFIVLYFNWRKIAYQYDLRSILLISFVFIVFLAGARLVIPNRVIVPYLFPIQAFGLTIACVFSLEIGLVLSLSLSILAAYGLGNAFDLTVFYLVSGLCGILILKNGRRIFDYFRSGLVIGIAGSAAVLAYRLPSTDTDWFGIATLIGASFLSGLGSASLTLLFQFLFAQALGLTTALQLMELSRPDHPLLQHLLRTAAGTYQHSLQVANLAEQAGEELGADTLLIRVGAIYHDIGKVADPRYFIENQVSKEINPHDDDDPVDSAAKIIQHVTNGISLAKKHRIPPKIQNFIYQHHGTLLTRYQYTQAVQAAGNDTGRIDKSKFSYPGPIPQSKETGLLMMADQCEARARADSPQTEEEIRHLVKKVVNYCQSEGQLDNTPFTLSDLNKTIESFAHTLLNIYHIRIPYPELLPNPEDTIGDVNKKVV